MSTTDAIDANIDTVALVTIASTTASTTAATASTIAAQYTCDFIQCFCLDRQSLYW